MKTVGYAGTDVKSWMSNVWQRYFDVKKRPDILALDYFKNSIAYSRHKHPNLYYGFTEEWIKSGKFYRRRTAFPVVLCHAPEEILNTTLDASKLLDNVPSSSVPSGFLADQQEPKSEAEVGSLPCEADDEFIPTNTDFEDDEFDFLKFYEDTLYEPSLTIKQDALRLDYLAELIFTCETVDAFARKAADTALYNLSAPVTTAETVVYSVVRRLAEIAAVAALREWTAYLEDWRYAGNPPDRLTWCFYRRLSDITELLKDGDGKERNKIARRSDNHIWLWIPDLASEFNSMLKYARSSDGTVRGLLLQVYEGKKRETIFERTKLNAAFMGGSAAGTVLLLDRDPHTAAHIPWVVDTLACYKDAIFIALELDKWTKKELELLEKSVLAANSDNLLVWTAAEGAKIPEIFKTDANPEFVSYAEQVKIERDEKFINKLKTAERIKQLNSNEIDNSDPASKESEAKGSIPYEEMPENLIAKARYLIFKIKGEDSEKANHPYMCSALD